MSSFGLSSARADASRRNGAKSRGPKTPEGKARSAQNALKHGLCAQKHVVLPGEDGAAFEAHEAALMEELAPEGALQTVLARRIVAATWRLERAERIEAELFAENHYEGGGLGLALIRDCNSSRAFETLVRYRGGTLAELWRALRTLEALQAGRADRAGAPLAQACAADQAAAPTRHASVEPGTAATREPAARTAQPNKPKDRRIAGDSARNPAAQSAGAPAPAPLQSPGFPAPFPLAGQAASAPLLAGTALARRADGFPATHGPSNSMDTQD
jgi:hypothetical protein